MLSRASFTLRLDMLRSAKDHYMTRAQGTTDFAWSAWARLVAFECEDMIAELMATTVGPERSEPEE